MDLRMESDRSATNGTFASSPRADSGTLIFDGRKKTSGGGGGNSLHQLLGGGVVADVMLWRRKDVAVGILVFTVGTYLVVYHLEQTLLSFLSKVALLLTSVLFIWAKAATLLRRQLPPLPDMTISEESMISIATSLHFHLNSLLAAARDIALGKETHLFLVIASSLWLLSVIGNLMDLVTLGYTCLVLGLTVPALCEKYGYLIARCITLIKGGYEIFEASCSDIVKKGGLHKKSLSE